MRSAPDAASAPDVRELRQMQQDRTTRRRRHAGRLIALTVLGWALFSREEHSREPEAAADSKGELYDMDSVAWDLPTPTWDEPVSPAPDAEPSKRIPPPRRRLATSLAFATLFFAGAALSAGAGD